MTPRGRQSRLRRAVPAAAQRAPHRKAELTGQVVRLIEAALPRPNRVERHGHDRISAGEHIFAGVPHETAERSGEQPAALVLERVKNVAKRAFVKTCAARDDKPWRAPPASGAVRIDRPPRRERIPASHTTRWHQSSHREPARLTDGTRERTHERRATRCARRREKHPNKRVDGVGEHDVLLRAESASARPSRRAKCLGNWKRVENSAK